MPPSSPHWLDPLVIKIAAFGPHFSEGWGDETVLEDALNGHLTVRTDGPPVNPQFRTNLIRGTDLLRADAVFPSPLAEELPHCAQMAHARLWRRPGNGTLLLVYAATGEVNYFSRERVWLPLVEAGVDLLMLESPLYGRRARPGQLGSALFTVADELHLVRGALAEGLALLRWGRHRYQNLAVAGASLGGYLSLLTAAHAPGPLQVFAFQVGVSPAPIFCDSVFSGLVHWKALSRGMDSRDAARQKLHEVFTAVGDLRRYPQPGPGVAVSLKLFESDGFISRENSQALIEHWGLRDVEWGPGGHVSPFLNPRRHLLPFVAQRLSRL